MRHKFRSVDRASDLIENVCFANSATAVPRKDELSERSINSNSYLRRLCSLPIIVDNLNTSKTVGRSATVITCHSSTRLCISFRQIVDQTCILMKIW